MITDTPGFRNVMFEETGYINVSGGKVWYAVAGAGKKGTPLLTVHGGPGATHHRLEPLAALADERPVVFYDQLGCGASDVPHGDSFYTIERYAEEIAVVRKALGLDRVHVMGHSWGTILAVEHAAGGTDCGCAGDVAPVVKSLVLSSPCLDARRYAADCRALVAKLPKSVRDIIYEAERTGKYETRQYLFANDQYFRRHVCRLDPWPDCLKKSMAGFGYEVYSYMCGPSEFTQTGVLRGFDNSRKLGLMDAPILFTCGEFDEVPPSALRYYSDKARRAEIFVVAGASHDHFIEDPVSYIGRVRRFLSEAD